MSDKPDGECTPCELAAKRLIQGLQGEVCKQVAPGQQAKCVSIVDTYIRDSQAKKRQISAQGLKRAVDAGLGVNVQV